MTEKNGKTAAEWAFDFGTIKTAGDLMKIENALRQSTMRETMVLMSEFLVSWPLNADPDDPDAWIQMDMEDWLEGKDLFADAVLNFLDHKRRRSVGTKARRTK